MAGYWNPPEAASATILDGWLHTGDVVRVDETGRVHMTAVLEHCRTSAGRLQGPGYVTVLPGTLPRNASGKLLKRQLCAQVQWGAPVR